MYGVMLLGLYLLCDSFTSQWQSRVYKVREECSFLVISLYIRYMMAAMLLFGSRLIARNRGMVLWF